MRAIRYWAGRGEPGLRPASWNSVWHIGLSAGDGHGWPELQHIVLANEDLIWAPAITGAVVLTTRRGDFRLHIGQAVSIGDLSHDDGAVRL
jgi:uncharacterized linocin/CFP29 family protein